MKCVIYRRVSTDEQAEKGFSLENQKLRLESFATSQGWEVVGDYVDDGFSGKNMDRPALKRMFNNVDKFDVIIVYKLDRFTRSVKDLNEMLEKIKEHNIAFKSATESIDTTTATGRMILNMMGTTAQWERETICERVRDVFGKMREQGLYPNGKPTYGYKMENGTLSLIPDEVENVKLMFEMIKSHGQLHIAKTLRARGIKTTKGYDWMGSSIGRLLRNPFYYGEMEVDGKMVKVTNKGYEPIITKEEFDIVSKIINKRVTNATRTKSETIYPFSGIVLCPVCGHPLRGDRNKYKEKYFTYYRCKNIREGTCNSKRIRTEIVDRAFAEYISGSLNDPEIKIDQQEDESMLRKELNNMSKKIERVKDLYIDGDISKSRYKEQIEKINNDMNAIQDRLLSCQDESFIKNVAEQVRDLDKVWTLLDEKTKAESIRSIFDTLTIEERDKNIIITGHTFL
ncbi:hypothetical protein COI97_15890 [Bacillus cereus]|nr:hypothetical protein COI97_15890 [Bacillus cereus]